MRTIHVVLGVALAFAATVPAMTPATASHQSSCTTPGPNQPCQFFCHLGSFIHVWVGRDGFGSAHATAACGDASTSCLATGFDASCEGRSLIPATKTDIGVCITDTTDSTATCWVSDF